MRLLPALLVTLLAATAAADPGLPAPNADTSAGSIEDGAWVVTAIEGGGKRIKLEFYRVWVFSHGRRASYVWPRGGVPRRVSDCPCRLDRLRGTFEADEPGFGTVYGRYRIDGDVLRVAQDGRKAPGAAAPGADYVYYELRRVRVTRRPTSA
jgi:hypothetical protein